MSTVTLSGMFSGIDSNSIIAQIVQLDQVPITQLTTQRSTLDTNKSDYGFISSSLSNLQSTLQAISDPTLFQAKAVSNSNTSVGNASVDSTATAGSAEINVTQIATTSVLRGGNAGGAFSDTKVTAPPSGSALIGTVLNADLTIGQTFTINGVQITLNSGNVIDDGNASSANSVIGKINTSGAGVTATYNATTGKFALTSATPTVLGSGADTSDFLQQAQLFNNGSTSITSDIGIGRLNASADLTLAGLRTAPTAGTFAVNGVSITYNSGDTLNTVLQNITASAAGVNATYDSYTDRIVLTSSTRGAQGIAVSDGTSNLATALRLTSSESELSTGKSTLFTVGIDPTVRQSADEILTATELGVTGLTFTALAKGDTTLTVAPDTATIKGKIDAFVTQYNSTQSLVESYIKIDPTDLSQNGILASDSTLAFLPNELRSNTTSAINSSSTIRMLEDLGIVGNSTDNTLTLTDQTMLDNALKDHPQEVASLFTDSSSGLSAKLGSLLTAYDNGSNGVIVLRQNSITDQQKNIDDQVARLNLALAAEQARLQSQFALLDAIQGTTQNLNSLFGAPNSTSTTTCKTV